MANSTQTVVSDGGLVLLDISFDYLDRSEITVYFDSALTSDWAWVGASDKQITFDPAVPVGTVVLVKRTTAVGALRHQFTLGAAFTAQSLDEGLKQVLHIAQEATEANFSSDFYGDINMHGNRITEVGDAVESDDLPSFGQLNAIVVAASAEKDAAALHAAAAAASEAGVDADRVAAQAAAAAAAASEAGVDADRVAAQAAAAAALVSETNAASSASSASTSATNASNSASAAATSATNAATSETNAATSETNAALSLNGIQDSKQTIWVPGGAMMANGGAVRTAFSYGSVAYSVLECADAASQYGTIAIRMPKGYDGGLIQAQIVWRSTATGSGDVRFSVSAAAMGDGNSLSASFGTLVYVLDTSAADSGLRVSEVSADITIGNVAGKVQPLVVLRVYRHGSDALDTLAQACQILGVTILYNTTTLNDA